MRSVKQIFNWATIFFSCNVLNVNSLECISMSNQECKLRPEIINVNSDKPSIYPYIVKTSKCSGSCNNINDPYGKMCIPDVVKNINLKVFNLMLRTKETRCINWHETL